MVFWVLFWGVWGFFDIVDVVIMIIIYRVIQYFVIFSKFGKWFIDFVVVFFLVVIESKWFMFVFFNTFCSFVLWSSILGERCFWRFEGSVCRSGNGGVELWFEVCGFRGVVQYDCILFLGVCFLGCNRGYRRLRVCVRLIKCYFFFYKIMVFRFFMR